MASRTSWLHVLALVSAASMPAAGAAQEPGAYGGGTLDAGALGRRYHPTVGGAGPRAAATTPRSGCRCPGPQLPPHGRGDLRAARRPGCAALRHDAALRA